MKNVLKTIFVIVFVTLSVFAFSSRSKLTFKTETPAAAEDVSNSPRDLYLRNCARCHGADGKAQTELGRKLDAADLTAFKTSVKKNIKVITRGGDDMPAFGKKLKKSDISALANYVRGL